MTMTAPNQIRQMSEPPHVTDQRHAQALSEIQKMRQDYAAMQQELADAKRMIERLNDRIVYLDTDKEHYRTNSEVFQRKLIRLAAAMSSIGKLSAEAEQIMKDAREFEEQMDRRPSDKHTEAEVAILQALRSATSTGEEPVFEHES